MNLNRKYVTPLIALIFLVVGISGLCMFFHLFDGYTEVVHEYLGVAFFVAAICHAIINWNALKFHFKKKVFIPAAIAVTSISIAFIIMEKLNEPIDIIIINKVVKAPINQSLKLLGIDYRKASENLKKQGILIEYSKTLEELWLNNDSNPEQIIDWIME